MRAIAPSRMLGRFPARARPFRPIYVKWADAYKKETGDGLTYQSIGWGAGIEQIRALTVTFGATDAPLDDEYQTSITPPARSSQPRVSSKSAP